MTDLIKLLDELDRLEKDATPVPWDGYDNIQPVRNRDFILALRNNWPRISKALRDSHDILDKTLDAIADEKTEDDLHVAFARASMWLEKYGE